VLPSDSILESNELLDSIFDYYSSGASIYCSYFANLELVMTNHPLSLAPFSGAEGSAALTDASLLEINPSYQPIIYKNNSSSNPIGYVKYSPSNLTCSFISSLVGVA
jgi:hypothetical protein